VPFAAQRRLVSALELDQSEEIAMQTYADKMARIVESLCRSFRPNAVNLLCLHTHLEGAIKGSSERQIHLGDDWAALPGTLPADAHYIALGHLHRPQKVDAPSPAYYAGSPLQLDFGEAGEEKSFVVVNAAAGPKPAQISRVPYIGGKPLLVVRATLSEIENRAEELRAAGWLRVLVPLEAPDPDINLKVRSLLPNAVSVDAEHPQSRERQTTISRDQATPSEMFRQYFLERYGYETTREMMSAFEALQEEVVKD
jgi:exonuclease SbcD